MSDQTTIDPGAEAVLKDLQKLFAPHGTVAPVQLNNPAIVEEFRPGATKNTDLANVPKPALNWAFAVELGAVHGDARLCAIVFTHFSRLQAFYAANPALHGGLITGWHGAAAIWMRAAGQLPRNFATDGVHWCASGIVPVGCPKQPVEVLLSQVGEIKLVEFNLLVWNEQQQAEIERLFVEAEVGGPFRRAARGRRVLNLAFWASYFTGMMPVTYDAERSLFACANDRTGTPTLLSEDDMVKEFTSLLQIASASFGARFPQGEIRPSRVRQLVERIKLLTQKARVSDGEVLDGFLERHVVRSTGKNIASQELRAAYIARCQALGRPACPEPTFYRTLLAKIRTRFGIAQRHDIMRNGKKVRGYGGLSLKGDGSRSATDGADASDASDGA